MDRSSWIQGNVNCSNEWSKSELQRKDCKERRKIQVKD
jgi:hypothetical protein